MQVYSQSTGRWLNADGDLLGIGYSGLGVGLNNPAYEDVEGIGPIPFGRYTIKAPVDDNETGPYSMHLVPDADNEMYGRWGFLIHGDNATMDHTASHGCIILTRPVREAIWGTGDARFTVTH